MDKLPSLGRGINEVLVPTFAAYEDLLRAKEAEIRSVRRETHTYGPNPRHVLDVYFPDDDVAAAAAAPRRTVLVFLHGGGFYAGARVNEAYAGGLIFGNIGRFFTAAKSGSVTVVVPDYRLLAHGARYPSGGEDVALVADWVRTALAGRDGYGGGIDLVLLGNSAGGVHVATFLLDAAFEAARNALLASGAEGEGGARLRGAVFLGTPFHFGDAHDEAIRAYLGEQTVMENSPIGRLRAALERGAAASQLPVVKVLIMVSELDPQFLLDTAEEFKETWKGADVEIQVLQGHNHISPQLGLGTGIEREEAWGVQLAEFLRACASS
ncbi:Alpha/Beta hydrolase protein [Nemania sp. NC0429]|nr:Alpha/Beta hydrolase protein [Nemania sp. NC0429]